MPDGPSPPQLPASPTTPTRDADPSTKSANNIQVPNLGPERPSLSIESISKSTASFLLLIYGVGFVIVGFHDARSGVVQFSPFRTRIMLVGLVFAALTGLCAWAQHTNVEHFGTLKRVRADNDPTRRTQKETVLAAGFVFTATLMANLLSLFLFASVHKEPVSKWRFAAWIATYFSFVGVFEYIDKIFALKPMQALLLSIISYVAYIGSMSAFFPNASWAQLSVFFALVGFETMAVKRSGGPFKYLTNFLSWPLLLLIVWIYISQIFSALPPRWGGGQPAEIVIYLNTPVPWSSDNPLQSLLLDETDQGLYVLLSPSGRAFYVPRTNIATIFFGAKAELNKKP